MSNPSLQRRNAPLAIEYLAPSSLKPMQGAPRRHPKSQIKSLSKPITAFGFNVPILVDGERRIISGHARVEADESLGLSEVPGIRIEHLTDAQIKAFMLAENRLAELATWDERALGSILLELSELELDFDIDATGFALAEIELRIEGLNDQPTEEAEIPVVSGPAVTRPGDLWQLGDHRLLCGSAL
jgi:ParB-like chromosome segregation protein Spo0J